MPPRCGEKKNADLHVGRGPVPRHRPRNPTRAGETRSDARVASEGPHTTKKTSLRSVGPKTPLLMMEIAGDRPPRYGNIEIRRSLLPVMKHPHYIIPCSRQFVNYRMRLAFFSGRRDIPVLMPQDVSSTEISSLQPRLRCGFRDTFHIRIRECRRRDIVAVIRDTAVRYGVNDNVDELPRGGRCEFV